MKCNCLVFSVNVLTRTVNCVYCSKCWAMAWLYPDQGVAFSRCHTLCYRLNPANLARGLKRQGKYGAEILDRRALEGREKRLRKEPPKTLLSVSNLAGDLMRQGKYEEGGDIRPTGAGR